MKKAPILVVAMLLLATQAAWAQMSTPADTSSHQTQTTQPAPTPMPTPAPAPAPARPQAYRYGGLSGGWLRPTGDFDKIVNNGWMIIVEGYQFAGPARKIAVGSQIGYQSFGKKNGVGVSNFPVDAVLKFFPKPGKGKTDLYVTGGLGFNYERVDVNHSSSSNYYFGTQAGVGAQMHGSGPLSFVGDAVYHWIYASGTGNNFVALRLGIVVPMIR